MEGVEGKGGFIKRTQTALVCEDNQELQKTIISVMTELQYKTDVSLNVTDALEKIKFNQYDVIVLNERCAGKLSEDNEVLKQLQAMPMSIRRHTFLALLGKHFSTQDNMAAFERSVNVVINEDDISNFKDVLEFSVFDNEQFYKVYKESLIKLGKK